MDYNVLTWREKHYKKICFAIVVLASVACIWVCIKYESISNMTFYSSSAYALVLFILGLFYSNQNSKGADLIYVRADLMYKLKKIDEYFEDASDYPIYNQILRVRGFSGRSKSEIGARYKVKLGLRNKKSNELKELEDKYLDITETVIPQIKTAVRVGLESINSNDLSITTSKAEESVDQFLKKNGAQVFSIVEYASSWILDDNTRKAFKDAYIDAYINNLSIQKEIEELEDLEKRIDMWYKHYRDNVSNNIKCINKLYGERIYYALDQLYSASDAAEQTADDLSTELDSITSSIEHIENVIESVSAIVEDIMSDHDNYKEFIDLTEINLENLFKDIKSIKAKLECKE